LQKNGTLVLLALRNWSRELPAIRLMCEQMKSYRFLGLAEALPLVANELGQVRQGQVCRNKNL